MSDETEPMLPCPFCGAMKIYVTPYDVDDDHEDGPCQWVGSVWCHSCDSNGPSDLYATQDQATAGAIRAWNRRCADSEYADEQEAKLAAFRSVHQTQGNEL